MPNSSIVPHSLDDYFQSTPIGSLDKAIGNNLYGINHRQTPNAVPSNKDTYGLTFFVRPQLNMQIDNIRNVRLLSPLATVNNRTVQFFTKCMLDPRLMAGYRFQQNTIAPLSCPMVDNLNAFIPVLTNNLNSISGWPDITLPTYDAQPGLFREGFSMADGLTRNFEQFDIDASFRNTKGDPILYTFYVWLHYMSNVFRGTLMPYLDMITENEIDYNTRIYRLVLDKDKNKVTKIAATGAAFPISVPTGSFFDYTTEKPYNDQNKDITIRFRCMGIDCLDDILIREFNDTVVIFNPDMADGNRERNMVAVPKSLLGIFNNRGYPRINPYNNDLEWYVSSDLFRNRTTNFINANISPTVRQAVEDLEEERGD
jgi:hypothetical protein